MAAPYPVAIRFEYPVPTIFYARTVGEVYFMVVLCILLITGVLCATAAFLFNLSRWIWYRFCLFRPQHLKDRRIGPLEFDRPVEVAASYKSFSCFNGTFQYFSDHEFVGLSTRTVHDFKPVVRAMPMTRPMAVFLRSIGLLPPIWNLIQEYLPPEVVLTENVKWHWSVSALGPMVLDTYVSGGFLTDDEKTGHVMLVNRGRKRLFMMKRPEHGAGFLRTNSELYPIALIQPSTTTLALWNAQEGFTTQRFETKVDSACAWNDVFLDCGPSSPTTVSQPPTHPLLVMYQYGCVIWYSSTGEKLASAGDGIKRLIKDGDRCSLAGWQSPFRTRYWWNPFHSFTVDTESNVWLLGGYTDDRCDSYRIFTLSWRTKQVHYRIFRSPRAISLWVTPVAGDFLLWEVTHVDKGPSFRLSCRFIRGLSPLDPHQDRYVV